MKTAQEILDYYFRKDADAFFDDKVVLKLLIQAMEEYAESYHQTKFKNLAQPDVSGSNCQHKNRTHVHHVGSYFEPKYGALYERCEDCGEKLNLIEYGDARGKTKWWQ